MDITKKSKLNDFQYGEIFRIDENHQKREKISYSSSDCPIVIRPLPVIKRKPCSYKLLYSDLFKSRGTDR